MSDWWYLDANEQRGLIDEEKLRSLVGGPELTPETLVWTFGMPEWLPAKDVQLTRRLFLPPPPPMMVPPAPQPAGRFSRDSDGIVSATSRTSIDQGHGADFERVVTSMVELPRVAWKRYFAKTIDLTVVIALILLCLFGLSSISPVFGFWLANPENEIAIAFCALILTPVIEGLMACTVGNTPGKAFLGLVVRDVNGDKLKLSGYIARNIRVAIFGLGAFLPIVTVITALYQYSMLRKHGFTAYDVGRYLVLSEEVSKFRIFLAALLAVGLSVFGIALEMQSKIESYSYSSGREWINPVTSMVVNVPGGWTIADHENSDGQSIYIFTRPSEKLQVVLGYEELSSSMSFPQYIDSFVHTVSADMRLEPPGHKETIGQREVWTVKGGMVVDPDARIAVTFLSQNNVVWRTVSVRFDGAVPGTDAHRILRERLLLSAM